MLTIQQVILDNAWKSSSFLQSTEVTRLFNSGIVTMGSDSAQNLINAMDFDNVQSTTRVGMLDYEWAEQNLGDATDDDATSLEAFTEELDVKVFYGNQWWAVRTIQKDLLNETMPMRLVLNKIGGYWAKMYNRIIASTVSGMGDITEITIGDGTANLSRQMVIDARKLKGDMGFGRLAKMYMNSTTMADILTKQAAGTINELITEKYGQVTVLKDGVSQVVQNMTPEYVYNGVTMVVVDDAITNGIISLIDDGAFAFVQKELTTPMMYLNSPKGGNGTGKEEWGTKNLYFLHPVGFSFVGVFGTSYAKKSGLTLAELQAGSQYALSVDAKLAPITNLKVLIGAGDEE